MTDTPRQYTPKLCIYPNPNAIRAWVRELKTGQPANTIPAFREDLPREDRIDEAGGMVRGWFLPIPVGLHEAPEPISMVNAWPLFPDAKPPQDAQGTEKRYADGTDGATDFATAILAGPREGVGTTTGQRIFGVLIRKSPLQPRHRVATPPATYDRNDPAAALHAVTAINIKPYTRFALVVWDWRGGVWQGELNTATNGVPGNLKIRLSRRGGDVRPQWFGPWFLRPDGMRQARRDMIRKPDNQPV